MTRFLGKQKPMRNTRHSYLWRKKNTENTFCKKLLAKQKNCRGSENFGVLENIVYHSSIERKKRGYNNPSYIRELTNPRRPKQRLNQSGSLNLSEYLIIYMRTGRARVQRINDDVFAELSVVFTNMHTDIICAREGLNRWDFGVNRWDVYNVWPQLRVD